MSKTMTFEELFEEVKKLNIEPTELGSNKMVRLFYIIIGIKKYEIYQYHNSNKIYIGLGDKVITPPTKDPQKIYNFIKAIKELEDE